MFSTVVQWLLDVFSPATSLRATLLPKLSGLVCAIAMACLLTSVVRAAEEPKKDEAKSAATEAKEPAEKPDPYAVPDGTAEELTEFIKGVMKTQPVGPEARQKAIDAMLKAADKILAQKPNEEQTQLAIQILSSFSKSIDDLQALANRLKQEGNDKLARQVRGAILRRQLMAASRGQGDEQAETAKKLIEQVKQYLAESAPSPNDISLAMAAGRLAENTGDAQYAAATYLEFAKPLAESKNERLAEIAKVFEGVARRLALLGKPMKVEGKTLGGDPLDWSKYLGKVVLVDFWATWCGPCVAEVPNMKKLYSLYHDKGFDIVGISLDRSREDLDSFLKEKEIPWTIVYDGDRSATAEYYGVMAIPTMILVGPDGKVVSLTARGEQLREELAKLLGPVKEEEDKPSDESKPTPDESPSKEK